MAFGGKLATLVALGFVEVSEQWRAGVPPAVGFYPRTNKYAVSMRFISSSTISRASLVLC